MGRPRATHRDRRRHRTLVYCDDYGQLYGWWCRDCPHHRQPYAATEMAAYQSANHHEQTELKGTSDAQATAPIADGRPGQPATAQAAEPVPANA